jgi:acetyl-CoA carboxylase carboxyl transferase subunit beta
VSDARRPGARDLLAHVVDPGSWREWPAPQVAPTREPDAAYAADLAAARERSGEAESLIAGEGRVGGRRLVIVAGEFGFLGGSIGVVAAEILVAALERATRERLPVLAAPTSGGTRMQEGTIAFLQMVKITQAVAAHKRAGLPYVVYLRHPTTGGVFASWGSLGHITVAEPGALIGFLGPRVYEALYGAPFPAGVQTAENLYAHSLLDGVLSADELGRVAAQALGVLCGDVVGALPAEAAAAIVSRSDEEARSSGPAPTAWEAVTRSRDPRRPGVRALLRIAATDVTALNGTGQGESEPGLLLALARFGGRPCVVLGQDRRAQGADAPLGPAALRTARRGMRLAADLGLPLVTVIDTVGAALSREAEEGGLAGEIARSLADLVAFAPPTVCLLLGQGAGGAALALVPADRVVAAQHAWLSPLPPEGAAELIHRSTERAAEVAAAQGVGAAELAEAGVVDVVVAEHPDAAEEVEAFCGRVAAALAGQLADLAEVEPADRLAARAARFRAVGLRAVGLPAVGPQ